MQPRQIYASTLTRRQRRWSRRRSGGTLSLVLVALTALVAALSVLAIVLPGVA